MNANFVLRGHIIWCDSPSHINFVPHGYLVCENGRSAGVFDSLPERFQWLPLTDYGGRLVIPGMYDLHLHAPQYAYRGMGMDLELIDWLNAYAYPEEAKFQNLAYARRSYAMFADALKRSFTARFCCYATPHLKATLLLSELLEATGLHGYVGKLSMDQNAPADLCEVSAQTAAADCEAFVIAMQERFRRVKPIVTPRFVPSCTGALLRGLGELALQYNLPVQSHLSENQDEIAWVKDLHPEAAHYAGVYDGYGLLSRAVMAHVVYPEAAEIALLRERGTMVAHCPASNLNLRSGIAPIRKLLCAGVRVGLGTDVAGGESIDMLRAAADAIRVSKLYWRLAEQGEPALTFPEALFMATKGGGSFFGQAGSFETGYLFDALVLDDKPLRTACDLTLPQRLERALYLSGHLKLVQKYVDGVALLSGTQAQRETNMHHSA